jgi:hypothetical protein
MGKSHHRFVTYMTCVTCWSLDIYLSLHSYVPALGLRFIPVKTQAFVGTGTGYKAAQQKNHGSILGTAFRPIFEAPSNLLSKG